MWLVSNQNLTNSSCNFVFLFLELTHWLSTQARKTESSLQRIRQGAQRRAGTSSDVSDHSVSDTDKICMQLFLDIQVFFVSLPLFLTFKYLPQEKGSWLFGFKLCPMFFLQEYGRNLAALGVDATNIPSYRSLWQCVSPSDRQSVISL